MSRIPPHIIDEIMQTARIEEVIGEFVNLKRAGSNLKGLSPFVDEKTPSFMVSPAKQIFKCFSSGKGGTVVTFLMEKEHFSYPEALRWLANKYNIQVPEEEPQTAEELAAISERESLYIINDFAKEHFVKSMHVNEEGQTIGLSYFEERGFRKDIIERFQLGYCLNSGDDFTKSALKKGYKLEYLEKVGLTKTKEERSFDFFRGRVMFPIHSISGRVLGFGGRTLFTDKKIAKYFNSPESIIYNKSEILYGLYFAKGDIIKYDNCYLCEGYTDVISMHQAGVTNSVSSSGTSLTKEQIRLIKRYTHNITILYDGDAAGIKASFRGIDLILEEGLNVNVVLFPDGDDPDSYSKKVSPTDFLDFINTNKQDFLSFKTSLLLAEGDTDPLKKAQIIREVVQSIALIPDTITRSVFCSSVAKQFDIDEALIHDELAKIRKKNQPKSIKEVDEESFIVFQPQEQPTSVDQTQPKKSLKTTIEKDEFELIRLLLKYSAYSVNTSQINEKGQNELVEVSVSELIHYELLKDELTFTVPLFQEIYAQIIEGLNEKTFYKPSFWQRHTNQEIVKLIVEIETDKHDLSQQWFTKYNVDTKSEVDKLQQAVMNAIYNLKLAYIKQEYEALENKLRASEKELTEEELIELTSSMVILNQVKLKLAKELNRSFSH